MTAGRGAAGGRGNVAKKLTKHELPTSSNSSPRDHDRGMNVRTGPLAALLVVASLGADAPHPKGYVCYRATDPIKVDGRLDDASWSRAAWTDDFVDIEGDAKPKPRFRTRVKMLWDERYFYVAAEMEEPDVWGKLTQHDSVLFHDLDFEVFVDPDGDNHEYAELEVNALNTTWDLFLPKPYRDGGGADNSFEIDGLKSAVHIRGTLNKPGDRDEGWTLEIAMPWASFAKYAHAKCPPSDGDRWRVNFSRVEWQHRVKDGAYEPIPRTEDNWVWSPQHAINMHKPEHWGYVQFASGEPGSVAFRPDPSWPARARLMAVYEAQQFFRRETGRYARSLGKLGIDPGKPPVVHRTTTDGFEASVLSPVSASEVRNVSIGHDSHIVAEPSPRESRR